MAKRIVKKLTPSNTKQEMLDAYSKLVEEIETTKENEINATEKIEEKQTKTAIEITDGLSSESINKEIADLKFEISTTLSSLSEKIEAELSKYHNVKKATLAKENELQEIFEIQKNAESLYALLEAQKVRKEEFEEEMENLQNELESEIEDKRSAWEKEKIQRDIDNKEREKQEQALRTREKEEYQYKTQREQQIARDKFESEKASLEKELTDLKEKTEKELTDLKERTEKELAGREIAITESEAELKELRTKSAEFPAILARSIDKAVKDATERIIMEAKHKEELLKSTYEGEKKSSAIRIETLERSIKEQNELLAKYSLQLEKSYTQIQDIATNAVTSSASKQMQPITQSYPKE